MFALMLGLCVGTVLGGAIVFATVSWIANHIATYENNAGKFGIIQTSRVQIAVKIK